MSLILMNEDVIRDQHTLALEAQGLSLALLQEAFKCEGPNLENDSDLEVTITFSKESLITLATMLHQLANRVKNQERC